MIGSTLGRYRILEKIGKGGMGEVFLADDTSLQRKVALKFLPQTVAEDAEARERFLVEAQAAAGLSHPNICVIHEVGEAEGRPFIAMEYVEGVTVQEKIRAGALEYEEVLSITTQMAAGLEEAHGKGIIHRDIKSSNVMVTPRGQAKIMDFGLAKVRGGPALTKTQTTLGTVAYMSPEQASGDEVDHRTDLWSAGVVLYEMLTGELPFPGDRETAVIYHILNEPPKPFEELKPPIPVELRQVVVRALKKKREARYASAGEMLADLGRYEEALRAEAAGVFDLRTLARRLRRPAVAIPTVLAAIALAVFAVWFIRRRADVRWAREVALPEIERMIRETDVQRDLVPPYRLAEEAEAILGDDPELAALFSQVSLNIDVRTDPPGANVYMREYSDPDTVWEFLGVTPLEGIRVPIGVFRWRFEEEGYEPAMAAASTWDLDLQDPQMVLPSDLVRVLDRVGSIPPGMVRVPGAVTAVGEIGDFFLDRYEVTNREYKAFVDAGGYRQRDFWKHEFLRDGRVLTWEEAVMELVDQTGLPGPASWYTGDFPEGEGDYPVSGVSWYEAAAYAEYAGKSLPTAVHWNVARGAFTPMVRWPQLGGMGLLAPFSNFNGAGPVPVGSLSSLTAYGSFDMPGNVREWCWNETPNGRVIRGGAWDDNPYMFGYPSQAPAMNRSGRNGFRLALYPDPETIPAAAFQSQTPPEVRDFYQEASVPEAIFRVYKEQYSYDPSPLNARVESREESASGWIQERVSFDAAYGGERVTAYLHLPSDVPPPFQVVVYFPGIQAFFAGARENLEAWDEFNTFVSFLPRSGRAVLYPAYKGTFDRGDPALAAIHGGDGSRAYADYLVQLVQDFMRSVDYLETRQDVDTGKLAFYGLSWGGRMGAVIPAVDDRIRVSVLLSGGLNSRTARRPRPEADDWTFLTRVRTPTLMLNGRYDGLYGLEQGIQPMFDLLGTPREDKDLRLYDTDHIPPRTEYIKETIAWLDKYLGPVNR